MGQVDDVGAALDALGDTPTGDEARTVTGDYDPADTLAAVYEDLKSRGGGGSLPAGGSTGEVLTKASNADGDADWEAAGGGSQPQNDALNGIVKDYALTDGVIALLLDPSAQSWEVGKTYSLEMPTPLVGVQSIVHPSDDPSRKFKSCYLATPVSGSEEPEWLTDDLTIDGQIAWGAAAYIEWSDGFVYDGAARLVANGRVWIGAPGTTGAEEPAWPTAPNLDDTILDNDITWQNLGTVATWAADHIYSWLIDPGSGAALSAWVIPSVPEGFVFQMSVTTERTAVASGAEPDWSTVPVDTGQQVIGGGAVWEETTDDEVLVLTGMSAPSGASLLTVANAAAPGSAAKVMLEDEAEVVADYGADVESAEGNRFNRDDSNTEIDACQQITLAYANEQWQPLGQST